MKLEDFKKLYCKYNRRYDTLIQRDWEKVPERDGMFEYYRHPYKIYDKYSPAILLIGISPRVADRLCNSMNEEDDIYLTWVMNYLYPADDLYRLK